MTIKKGQGGMTLLALKVEEGGHEPRQVDDLKKLEKSKGTESLRIFKKELSLSTH